MESMETVDQGGLLAALGAVMFIYFALFLLITISLWKIFSKAGRPGWAAIVPIYNLIVWLDIVGKPTWWIILLLLPIVNLVIIIMITHQMSVVFGQGIGTTLLLIFLPFIGYPMLAFGSAQYTGKVPAAQPI
jgi:hypothetical protein